MHPKGMFEADAAHIVSRSLKGSDDTRNGIFLCKTHHWAFDYGMIGIDNDYSIIIPSSVALVSQNGRLAELVKRKIFLPKFESLWPSLDALAWHRENLLIKNN